MRKGGVMHKMISKKILASVFVISMLAFAIGWGTYSYFSDTETSSGNKFSAGTLDLKVDGKDNPLDVYFNVADVKPGDSGSKTIALKNDGTIEGTAKIHIKNVANSEGTNPEPETDTAEPGDLGKYLVLKIWYDAEGDGFEADDLIVTDEVNDLNSVLTTLGPLGAGQTRNVKIDWELPSDVGNDIMGDSVTFDIEFSLVQA
jgi:predicted ribosomally synthesized peptide with SipW-like signal peptide